ncbi:hypothetical protein [Wenyingzhuangia aestuarii]|uniref:hypothetical protein n=1 Tax=Wenyingzhuangia aestuarii TaxID=1647582 RepID=UPI0014387C40|nr:hypothetical protein [Wenyingzhuangia aestuarii]NJB84171.1 hypothetical protein [Wenyingzhuangia aestuarii]
MKIKSNIQVTELNRDQFIQVLENNNLKVTNNEKIRFKDLIKTYTPRYYPRFKPTISGEFYRNEWKINLDSVIFKSFLLGISTYIFFWANNAEIKTRIIIPIIFMIINYWINQLIIKTRIENIESYFRKSIKNNH